MKTWKVKKSEVLHSNPFFNLKKDIVEDFDGQEQTYWYTQETDGVMIVPITIKDEKITYTMVNQYRHPTSAMQLEFPKGALEKGESKEAGAKRELFEETGLKATWTKFMYIFSPSVGRSTCHVSVYLALVEGEPTNENAELSELGGGLEVVKVDADELLKKVQNNEIRDSHTLAALAAVMLQSDEAKRYIEGVN